ncbi:MAG: DUF455 family protein [Verrucomicrobiota bacterium]
MQLRDFAERILFSTSIEEKLARPDGGIEDTESGVAISSPERPGRTDSLTFAGAGETAPLPARPALEHDEQRAVLLHFFANHELLATELMALVLLRFPEAPKEFRRGLYQTLREEQMHTMWYQKRLEECGARFGDYPVNGFFWKVVSDVETPLDYVSRLSLTFEQANLDYARHYAGVLRESGDEKSAKILERVYRDEISHVGYGLEWFRRWKAEGMTDWEAYEGQLAFPLSPSRAKANGGALFNVEGRQEAGLTEEYIERLRVFERSKGRTPNVYWFNPGEENAMVTDQPAREPARERLAADLEFLMAFIARPDDVLLVRENVPLSHLQEIREAGFVPPELECLDDVGEVDRTGLTIQRKLADVKPWGWSARAREWASCLEPQLTRRHPGLELRWNATIRELSSKVTHQAWMQEFAELRGEVDDRQVIGRSFVRVEEFEDWEPGSMLLKAPFGASGQRNQRWQGEETRSWAAKVIQQQGAVVVEPWLTRVFDVSVQYEMSSKEGLRRLGYVRLQNRARGQFALAQCGPKPCQGLPQDLAQYLSEEVWPVCDHSLRQFLEQKLREAGYEGPVGVDTFVYRDADTQALRWRPIVEVNPRYTMGRLCYELSRKVAPGHCARLELLRGSASGEGEPIRLEEKSGRMGGGHLWLTPERRRDGIRARLSVARHHGQLGDWPVA